MISVALSSFNGADTLPSLLDSLASADVPDGGWELVIVNNASTDSTQEVLERRMEELPLSILYEPKAGKNVALNRALSEMKGDLFVFTDDDVLLPRNFLIGYKKISDEATEFDIFGGHIVPLWECEPSDRLLAEIPLNIAFAITETDRKCGEILAGRLYGPNFSVRRSVFDSGLLFDEAIGPNGSHYIMGDETDFLRRAARTGHRAWFEPGITVKHRVAAHQLERRWLFERAALAGRTLVHNSLRDGEPLDGVATLAGYPRWSILRYARFRAQEVLARLRPNCSGELYAHWHGGFIHGYAMEFRRLYRSGRLISQKSSGPF